MADAIKIALESNAAAIVRDLEQFPPAMAAQIAQALDLENELTVGEIQTRKLSRRGKTTLGVISNRLRPSVRKSAATVIGAVIDSAIGSNVKYAGAHEFGVDRIVTVRQHRTRHHSLDVFRVKGGGLVRGWEVTGALSVTGGKRAKRIAEGFTTVRQHSMHMQLPARAYIRTTIAERTENYRKAISGAIVSAWGGTN